MAAFACAGLDIIKCFNNTYFKPGRMNCGLFSRVVVGNFCLYSMCSAILSLLLKPVRNKYGLGLGLSFVIIFVAVFIMQL
jgi:hypothetical protein